MRKFDTVEGLRGYMAWWVVLGHALQLIGLQGDELGPFQLPAALIVRNEWAVDVFMIISGFVIAHLHLSRPEPYIPYLFRRFFRIWPLFVILSLLALVLREQYMLTYFDNPLVTGNAVRIARLQSEETYPILHGLLHLTMFHGLIPDNTLPYASSTILGPGWSLSLEWQFYLIAPLLITAMMRMTSATLTILGTSLVLMIAGMTGYLGTWSLPSFVMLALPFFMIGIASRLALEGRFAPASIIAAIFVTLFAKFHDKSVLGLAPVLIIWFVFLGLSTTEGKKTSRVPKWVRTLTCGPAITAIGRVSYSTYLAHIPIFCLCVSAMFACFGRMDRLSIAIALAIACLLALPLSFALNRYVERPGSVLGARLASAWTRSRTRIRST